MVGIIVSGEALVKYVSEKLFIGRIDDLRGRGGRTVEISVCEPIHSEGSRGFRWGI